ncbi:MAG TPA: sensor histidine kinase, partial [Bacteroidia bacterium]
MMHILVIHRLGFNWYIALTDSSINNVLLLILSFPMVLILHFYRPDKSKSFMLLGWSIILAVMCALVSNFVLSKIYQADSEYITVLSKSFLIRFCICFLMIGWVILFSWITSGIKSNQVSEVRKTDAEKLLIEAELIGLRQQLQPHF